MANGAYLQTEGGDDLLIACAWLDGTVDNNEEARANARRIVACWNACEGIPTQELEQLLRLDEKSRMGLTWRLTVLDALKETNSMLRACMLLAVSDSGAREIGLERVRENDALLARLAK